MTGMVEPTTGSGGSQISDSTASWGFAEAARMHRRAVHPAPAISIKLRQLIEPPLIDQ
jgi:hypothetical protein